MKFTIVIASVLLAFSASESTAFGTVHGLVSGIGDATNYYSQLDEDWNGNDQAEKSPDWLEEYYENERGTNEPPHFQSLGPRTDPGSDAQE